MSSAKYIGLDVHQATTVAAVLDGNGKLVMEAIVETKAATLFQFIDGISGELHVTLEEGTCRRLAARSAPASCKPGHRLRSAQECAAEAREQE
jgi:hypothetical protein